jgi:DNA-binding response OmpR family regulator
MEKMKILIIDDDKVTVAVLEEYLSDSGYTVYNAENGKVGIEMMSEIFPDIILLDVMMPGKDGIEILKDIKSKPEYSHIPILMLTSVDRADVKVKGFEIGADDYIIKPVNKAELRARIKASIKRSKANRINDALLTGNLEKFSLADLLQSAELGTKSAKIEFPDMAAELIIKNGFIISCKFGKFTGKRALNRIFFLNKGKFIVDYSNISEDFQENEKVGIMNTLMKNFTYIDECNSMLSGFSKRSEKIKITGKMEFLLGIKDVKKDSYMGIDELIVLMDGDIKENIESILQINNDFPFEFFKR